MQKERITPDTRHLIVAGSVILAVEFHPSKLTDTMWDSLRRMASEPEDLTRLKVSESEETPNVQPDIRTILRDLTRYADVAKAITTGMPPWNSGDQYSCMEEIAITAKSSVRKVIHSSDQKVLAVKMIVNKALSSGQVAPWEETLERELRISMLHATNHDDGHPNVVKVIDFCRWEGGRFLVMEFATFGNLQNYMHTISPDPLQEEPGRTIMVQVWRGLKWLHENDVSHGDLTASNVLLRSHQPFDCMISDFGESRIGRKQTTLPGALISMAPEVARINQHGADGYEYDAFQADIWFSGVLACQILTLQMPKLPTNRNSLGMSSALRKWAPSFQGLSQDCSNLLRRVLSQEPTSRPTATECLDDVWHVHYKYSSATVNTPRGEMTSDSRSSGETVRPTRSGSPTPTPRVIEWLAGDCHPNSSKLRPPPGSFSSLPDTAVPSFSSPLPEPESAPKPSSRYFLRPRAARKA